MDCPKCVGRLGKITVKLNTAYRSEKFQGEGTTMEIDLDQCFVCNGVWFDAGELERYLYENMTAVDSPGVGGAGLTQELDHKTGKCPRCSIDMVKKKAPKDSSITIDQCETCQGIWLDNSEIDHLEKSGKSITDKISKLFGRLFGKK